jgi:hypothetical protein
VISFGRHCIPSPCYKSSKLQHERKKYEREINDYSQFADTVIRSIVIIFTEVVDVQLLRSYNSIGSASNPGPQISTLLSNGTSDSRTCTRYKET